MKRFLTLLVLPLIALTLYACGDEDIIQEQVPQFSHLVVDDRSPVVDGEVDPYVKDKEDTVRVEIHFENPANHPINSVVINGQRYYAVNRFEAGSNPQVAILELTLRLPGETTYEVQSFVYSEVNSVEVTSNNYFDVFVLKTLPSATLTNLTPGTESLAMDIRINDPDQVVLTDTSEARLYLDGDLVESITLIRGIINNIVFEDLMSDQDYHLEVVTGYNRDDGQGDVMDYTLLEDDDLSTHPKQAPSASIAIDDITADSVTFHVDITDQFDVIDIESVNIVITLNGSEYARIDDLHDLSELNDLVFSDLLSNNQYSIRIYASFDLNDEQGVREDVLLIRQHFDTLERPAPTLTANIINVTESSLVLSIDGTTVDDTVDLATLKAYIYDDATDELLAIAYLVDGELTFAIDGLLAHTTVRVEIEAIVDFQDGETPDYAVIFEETYQTAENVIPSGSVNSLEFTQTSVVFSVTINNTNSTIVPGTVVANLYENDVLIDSIVLPTASGTYAFEDVDVHYQNSYAVNLKVDYDLRDGEGTVEAHRLGTYVRNDLNPKAPIGSIDAITETSAGLRIDYTLHDNDSVLDTDGLEIDINGQVLVLDPTMDFILYENYLNNTTYDVTLKASYTLSNNASSTVLATESYLTSTLTMPSATIDSIHQSLNQLEVNLTINDADAALVNGVDVILYEGGLEIHRVTLTESGSAIFENINNNTQYVIVLEGVVNRNDGTGAQSAEFDTGTYATSTLTNPNATIDLIEDSLERIDVTITIDDPDNTLVNGIDVIMYDGEIEVDRVTLTASGTAVFMTINQDTEYTIVLEGIVNMNDGSGEETLVFATDAYTTPALLAPTITADSIIHDFESMIVTYTLDDIDNTLLGSIDIILREDGIEITRITVTTSGDVTFTNLTQNTDYTLVFEATYDLKDGAGSRLENLYVATTTTPRYLPTVTLADQTIGQETMNARFLLDDPYNLVDDATYLRVDILDQSLLNVGDSNHIEPNTKLFVQNLWSNYTYTVQVYATIDGIEVLVHEQTFKTNAKAAPSSSITDIDWSGADLEVTVGALSNPDDVEATFHLTLEIDGVVHQVIEVTEGGDYTFENVSGLGADYVVKLTVDYNLDDSLGLIEDVLLDTGTIVIADKFE